MTRRGSVMTSAIASRVKGVSEKLDLTQEEIGNLLGTTQRTVNRWATGESVPQALTKKRFLELVYIADQLSALLKAEEANLWIHSPNRLLGGESPADVIRRG